MMRMVAKDIFIKAFTPTDKHHLMDALPSYVALSIDSRTLLPGEVFFALRGEFDDGHRYIAQALAQGASVVVAEESYRQTLSDTTRIIFVADCLQAFARLAHLHLKSFKNLIKIAITGSNGKTTTKEMTKAVLSAVVGAEKIYASSGNRNNHFGVPLSAFEVGKKHSIAIFEMGMNHAKEIAHLCSIVEPNVGAITNISSAHVGNFSDGIEGVQKAKGELFQDLALRDGIGIVNHDDIRIQQEAKRAHLHRTISFSQAEADVQILTIMPFDAQKNEQTITCKAQGEIFSFSLPIAGSHHAHNAACALAIALALQLPLKTAASGFLSMKKTAGRMLITTTKQGVVLIDDGYNANPTSMKAGILASLEIPAQRRIAVLGAMGELGPASKTYHQELGALLPRYFDLAFICGADGRFVQESAKACGMKDEQLIYQESSMLLIEPLRAILKTGDVVFIKGSLSTNMQAVVKAFAAE